MKSVHLWIADHRARENRRRFFRFNISSISEELGIFRRREYYYSSTAGLNDMWIEVDFDNYEFETAVLKYIGYHLSRFYIPFRSYNFLTHCLE